MPKDCKYHKNEISGSIAGDKNDKCSSVFLNTLTLRSGLLSDAGRYADAAWCYEDCLQATTWI